MKVSLLFENFSKKILFANHAISSRSQLPILLNFLIQARNGKLTISATDLEIGIMVDIPAKTLTELISVSPMDKITLETSPAGLALTGEKIKTVFQTTPAEEFPKLYE